MANLGFVYGDVGLFTYGRLFGNGKHVLFCTHKRDFRLYHQSEINDFEVFTANRFQTISETDSLEFRGCYARVIDPIKSIFEAANYKRHNILNPMLEDTKRILKRKCTACMNYSKVATRCSWSQLYYCQECSNSISAYRKELNYLNEHESKSYSIAIQNDGRENQQFLKRPTEEISNTLFFKKIINESGYYNHTLINGGAGSGKTENIIKPLIQELINNQQNCNEIGFAVIDINNEAANYVADMCKKFKLDFNEFNITIDHLEDLDSFKREILTIAEKNLFTKSILIFKFDQDYMQDTLMMKRSKIDKILFSSLIEIGLAAQPTEPYFLIIDYAAHLNEEMVKLFNQDKASCILSLHSNAHDPKYIELMTHIINKCENLIIGKMTSASDSDFWHRHFPLTSSRTFLNLKQYHFASRIYNNNRKEFVYNSIQPKNLLERSK